MSQPVSTVGIELAIGKESAAIATLLSRQIAMIRMNKMADWYEYADIGDKFLQGLNKEIHETSLRDARRATQKVS
jgi:hypothetical protein